MIYDENNSRRKTKKKNAKIDLQLEIDTTDIGDEYYLI